MPVQQRRESGIILPLLRVSASPREQYFSAKAATGLALLLAVLPLPALAQADDIIVTATGVRQDAVQSGQAITVIDRVELETRQSAVVSDLLATTPGVTTTRAGGPGQTTAVRIRGAEDAQTLVLIDGVRVNDPASPGGAFDFGNLLTGNIDRIEVLRGPNSVPWGSQAIGGVVNIVTAPVDGANLRAEYGYKNARQIVAQAGGRFGRVTASLGGGYFDDGGISAFEGGTERDGFRQYAANGRVKVEITDAVDVDLRGYYADSRVQFDGFQSVFPFGQVDTEDYSKTQQVFGYAGINAALFDGALKNRFAFTLSDTRRDNYDPAAGSAPSFIARGRVERFEYQGDARVSSAIRAVFGIEHETSRFDDGFSRVSTRLDSAYLQAVVMPFDRLTLTGGARVDDHRTYGTKATFSANAAWRVGAGTIIRASYGEGFKAPTLFQLFSFFGNDALRPETARSYDAGIEQSLIDNRLKAGITAFRRTTGNQIDFFSCFGSDDPRCATQPDGFYENIARTRAEGVEAFVELRPVETLSFTANYSLIDTKNRDTGGPLLRRPRHSVNAGVDWTPRNGLKLGASLQVVGDSVDGFGGTTRLDGYTLASIRAALPIGDHLEVYARVENLFDARYQTVAGYGTFGRNAHAGIRVTL